MKYSLLSVLLSFVFSLPCFGTLNFAVVSAAAPPYDESGVEKCKLTWLEEYNKAINFLHKCSRDADELYYSALEVAFNQAVHIGCLSAGFPVNPGAWKDSQDCAWVKAEYDIAYSSYRTAIDGCHQTSMKLVEQARERFNNCLCKVGGIPEKGNFTCPANIY